MQRQAQKMLEPQTYAYIFCIRSYSFDFRNLICKPDKAEGTYCSNRCPTVLNFGLTFWRELRLRSECLQLCIL